MQKNVQGSLRLPPLHAIAGARNLRRARGLRRRGVRVERDRLVVLGDNPPVSRDSRAAPEGVPLDRILGRVIPRVGISDRG